MYRAQMHFFCSELWLRVYAFVSLMPGRGMLPCMQPSLFDEKHQLAYSLCQLMLWGLQCFTRTATNAKSRVYNMCTTEV